jgi:hypothetical protein
MIRIQRIAGEGVDADLVETREFKDPSYGDCPGCDAELDANSWCDACESYPHEIKLTGDWEVRVRENPDGSWSVAA